MINRPEVIDIEEVTAKEVHVTNAHGSGDVMLDLFEVNIADLLEGIGEDIIRDYLGIPDRNGIVDQEDEDYRNNL